LEDQLLATVKKRQQYQSALIYARMLDYLQHVIYKPTKSTHILGRYLGQQEAQLPQR